MNIIYLVLTLCGSNGQCDSYRMDSFGPEDVTKCEEVIIASGQKGAYPLRCEFEEK